MPTVSSPKARSEIVATAQRWLWGGNHATIGLVIVSPACQGRRLGHRLMSALLTG